MELDKKIALITGAGATGGIGAATAILFAREGADVIISGRDQERGEQALKEIEAGAGGHGQLRFILADLTDLDDVRELADQAGDVDILVNNAAGITAGPALEPDAESFDDVFATSVRGPYFLTAALARGMIARRSGSIVNISTMAARIGMPGLSVYSASKAAVESLTRTWAAEFADAGVRVNTVSPGPTRSDKVATFMGEAAEQLGRTTLLKRMASTDEIAQVVLFLASDRASYVTGATVAVDGGRTAI
jgi:NAD(P)-dependent dehydrogenase (short-subunit alcohol dehydrogenase family)